MTFGHLLKAAALFFTPIALLADNNIADKIGLPSASFEDRILRIEANQIPLGQALKTLESQANIRLHFSSLPQKTVSAHCAGNTMKVLKCLLGEDTNVMFRYPDKSSVNAQNNPPTDIWLLDAANEQAALQTPPANGCELAENRSKPASLKQDASNGFHLSRDEMHKLLVLSQAQEPLQRKEALSRLAIEGESGNIKVISALEAALTDPESSVRAQAIAGLVHRNEAGSESVLRDALHDAAPEVRLMAVDSAGQNIALLEEALADTNETVRALASMKLENIKQ